MKRILFLSILAYGVFFLGLMTVDGQLLALAVPLLVFMGAAFVWASPKPILRVTRSLSEESVFPGTPVVVKLEIVNDGPMLEEVLIEDVLPMGIQVLDGETRVLATLPTNGRIELVYTVRGKRGAFEFKNVRVLASDLMGVFWGQEIFSAPERLFVLPVVSKMRQVTIRPLRTRAYAGPIPSRQGGSGVAFFGVREYQLGDPLRRLNWRVSARHSHRLFTNEFEQERITDVGLILDARQRNNVRGTAGSLFEHAVAATASLATTFLNDGNRVGLLVYGGFLNWTFPGYGKMQRKRILESLAQAKTGESLIFESFDYFPTRFFPSKSQLVLVSPLCQEDLAVLIRLCARGYQVLVVSPDPVSFETRALRDQPGVGLASRIARLERSLLLHKLRRGGVQVVNWQVERPLERVIRASLGPTPQWFRSVGR